MKVNIRTVDSQISVSDILVIERGNGHQTPYMIVQINNVIRLINLHSGQSNYSISKEFAPMKLVDNYLVLQGNDNLNPITGYFFIKPYEATLSSEFSFGHTKI